MVSKTKSSKRAFRPNPAKKAALAVVTNRALNAGTSRHALVLAIAAACGPKPVMELFEGVRLEVKVGLVAAALRNQGDNRPDADLIAHSRERLTRYQGFGGSAALRKGMLGRRTAQEEAALKSATVQLSGLLRDAKVTNPEPRGGTNKGQTKTPTAKAPVAANNNAPAVRRFASQPNLVAYAALVSKAMADTINRSAKVAPNWLKSAVQDFNATIAKHIPQGD